MKHLILSISILFPLSLLAQKGFIIKGSVGKLDPPAMAYLQYAEGKKAITDSVVIKKGKFSFTGKVEEPTNAVVIVKHGLLDTARWKKDICFFYIENSAININAADSIKHAVVKGSKTNDENNELNASFKPVRDQMDGLRKEWTGKKKQGPDDQAYKKAADSMQRLMDELQAINDRFVAAHYNSYMGLVAFRNSGLKYNFDPIATEEELNKFPESLRSTKLGQSYIDKIKLAKNSQIGVMATDFASKDSTEHPVKLSDFRGRYVLVDFWASWCKPCRAENPNLIAAYNSYKDKNFTILGVSLDEGRDRKAWLRAIQVDGITWPQVSDLQGWKSDAAKLYGIDAIPSNFLVDPTGKIIARNLRGEELNKKLSEIF